MLKFYNAKSNFKALDFYAYKDNTSYLYKNKRKF